MNPTERFASDPARLPPMTVELALLMTDLETKRDIFGMNHCRDRVVGAMRKQFGPAPVEPPSLADVCETARDQARFVLERMCALCPHEHCKMKGWGITAPPS